MLKIYTTAKNEEDSSLWAMLYEGKTRGVYMLAKVPSRHSPARVHSEVTGKYDSCMQSKYFVMLVVFKSICAQDPFLSNCCFRCEAPHAVQDLKAIPAVDKRECFGGSSEEKNFGQFR